MLAVLVEVQAVLEVQRLQEVLEIHHQHLLLKVIMAAQTLLNQVLDPLEEEEALALMVQPPYQIMPVTAEREVLHQSPVRQ